MLCWALYPPGPVQLGSHMSSSDGSTGAVDLSLGSSRRGPKMKTSPFLVLAAGLLLFAAVVGGYLLITRPTTLRIAVGPPGSDDLNLIQALARNFSREKGPIRLALIPTAGPVDSISVLRAHKADLAVARGDEEMPDGTDSVAVLRKNVVVLWAFARNGSKKKLKSLNDLPGHRIAVLGRTQVNLTLLRVILKESGVDPDKVTVVQFNPDQTAAMAKDATIDAFMTVAPLDSKITAEALAATARGKGEPLFLPIDVSEAIASRHPLYESEEIPGSTFASSPARPDDKVETVGVNHLILAPKTLSDSTVAAFTRQLFAAKPTLARDMPSAAKIEKPDTDKDAALPAHPGAAAYIDGNERTFMDNYSDYIWAAVLLFSVLGSGVAGLRHYVKRDERKLTILHREKLLAAISLVRQINSIEELDAMQREADEFLRETLQCYDDGAIEQADLAAYSLVLDQFHNAVVDRRAVIGGPAANLPRMRVG
jgi:TRAP transporter TAXI family solute receptor